MLLGRFGTEQRHEVRRMVEVNLLGAMAATEVFLPQPREGGGDLVNIPPWPLCSDGPKALLQRPKT
jgi:NADP-dependent 3-hydroxy acid dehydrogenase YdfG